MKLFQQIMGLARAYPLITITTMLLNYFMTNNIESLMLSGALVINDMINFVLKYWIVKPLLGDKKYFLIGSGSRPKGAKNCSLFVEKNASFSKSYGMPSGHSQNAAFFSTYAIMGILNNPAFSNKFIFIAIFIVLALSVMYSRVFLKCHTVQQIAIGGLLGSILGLQYYNNKDNIKHLLKI